MEPLSDLLCLKMPDERSRPPVYAWPTLPEPAVIAQEIVEDLQAALEQFKLMAGDLEPEQRG